MGDQRNARGVLKAVRAADWRRRSGSRIQSARRHPVRLFFLLAAAVLAFGIGLNINDARQRAATAESRARTAETFALSSVGRLVPGRESVRKVQAVAIMEAQRMGLDISIVSVGVGARRSANAGADAEAFARLVQRFPETTALAEEGDPLRERLSKAWKADSKALGEGGASNAMSQIISAAHGRVGACVIELHAGGESLRAMLAMAYLESSIDTNERKARALGIAAADVAFLVSAHESAHCVIGMARRAGLFDIAWADPDWSVPPSWSEARYADDRDSPALAKAEESAADALAVLWAAEVLGARKAILLGRLALHARSHGTRSSANDGLHDSSRVLSQILAALGRGDRAPSMASPARLAWNTAVTETRREVLEGAAPRIAAGRPRR